MSLSTSNPILNEFMADLQFIAQQHAQSGRVSVQEAQMVLNNVGGYQTHILDMINRQAASSPGQAVNSNLINECANVFFRDMMELIRQNTRPAMGMGMGMGMPMQAGFPMQSPGMFNMNPMMNQRMSMAPLAGMPPLNTGSTVWAREFNLGGTAQTPAAEPTRTTAAPGELNVVLPKTTSPVPLAPSESTDASVDHPNVRKWTVHQFQGFERSVDQVHLNLLDRVCLTPTIAADYARRCACAATATHSSYLYLVDYLKPWVVRESPTKVNELLSALKNACNQVDDIDAFIDQITMALASAPAALSKMFEKWIVSIMHYYLYNGALRTAKNDAQVILTLSDIDDLSELFNRTSDCVEIRDLLATQTDKYLTHISNIFAKLRMIIKTTRIATPEKMGDTLNILQGLACTDVDGVTPENMLDRACNTFTKRAEVTPEEYENFNRFLTKVTVLLVPEQLWVTNIVPESVIDMLCTGRLSSKIRATAMIEKPANTLEWMLLNARIAVPIIINASKRLQVFANTLVNQNGCVVFAAEE